MAVVDTDGKSIGINKPFLKAYVVSGCAGLWLCWNDKWIISSIDIEWGKRWTYIDIDLSLFTLNLGFRLKLESCRVPNAEHKDE